MDFSNVSTEDLRAQYEALLERIDELNGKEDRSEEEDAELSDALDKAEAMQAELDSRQQSDQAAEFSARTSKLKSFIVHSSTPKGRKTPVSRPAKMSDLEAETQKYGFNYSKVLLDVQEYGEVKGKCWEADYCKEASLRNPNAQGNVLIPRRVSSEEYAKMPKNAFLYANLDTTTGANSMPVDWRDGQIDLLRAASLIDKMGFQIETGLKQKTTFVVQDGDPTLTWFDESDTPTPTNPTYRTVSLDPKQAVATVALTRKYMRSTPNANNYVLAQMLKKGGNGIDVAWINGAGDKQPLGLLNITALTAAKTSFGGAVTWPKIVEMEAAVLNENGGGNGPGKYFSNYKVGAGFKTTAKSTTAGAGFIFEPGGTVNGQEFIASSLVPSNLGASPFNKSAIIYGGDWSQAVVGFFNDEYLDVLVDEYSGSGTGLIKLNMYIDMDFQLLQYKAFNIATDVATS